MESTLPPEPPERADRGEARAAIVAHPSGPRRKVRRVVGGIAIALVVVFAVFVYQAFREVNRASAEKAVIGNLRQISAAASQYFLEFGAHRIFVGRDELVGPDRYAKVLNPVRGEDYAPLFPVRRDQTDTLTVTLPDGRQTHRTEILGVTMPWGRVVDYPGPDDADGKKQDGVHTLKLPDGRFYKITYRGGVPDGPFRAYYPDGALWGEATYLRGRVVGNTWLHARDGRKFNELTEREKADAALTASDGR